MGPCFRGMENDSLLVSHSCAARILQWGHALGAWKTRFSFVRFGFRKDPSMGPCFRGMENLMTVYHQTTRDNLQWGHALGAWKTACFPSFEIAGVCESDFERSQKTFAKFVIPEGDSS